jgi:hypothetical protein
MALISGMTPTELKPNKGEILRSFIDFAFGFENKKGEILDHWIAQSDSFSFPPQQFYETVEKELQARKVPAMKISRQEFCEGGLLSDKRTYLCLTRERLHIYACAAAFGTGYFFSCRTVYVPALVRLWHILATLLCFGAIGYFLLKPLGLTFTIIALVALAFAFAATFRNVAASAVEDVDALLLKIPVVSTIYQDWFRQDTFFRVDTRAVYLQRIPALIKEMASNVTAANGVKLVNQYSYAPVLGELYKPMATPKRS